MTDEQRIGEAGAEHVLRPEPAGHEAPPAERTSSGAAGTSADEDDAWDEEERNEEAVTHGSP